MSTTWIIVIIIVFMVIIGLYAVILLKAGKSVVTSKLANHEVTIDTDMVYYLPAASLIVNATATVILSKDNQMVTKAKLQNIALDNTVSITPDTRNLICLDYVPNIFMNDEIRLTTSATGLLDSVNTTTDDQLGNILKQAGDLSGDLKPADFIFVAPSGAADTSIQTFTKTFRMMPDELKNDEQACPWIIFTDNSGSALSQVDASFVIKFEPPKKAGGNDASLKLPATSAVGGLYTRPLTTRTFSVKMANTTGTSSKEPQWEITVPDCTRLINIPVTRSAFVKRINTPKFSSGLISENYINLPSQFEGFISIPINILKAIVSIPSALFNFKIHHQYDNTLAELAQEKKLADAIKALKTPTNTLMGGRPPGM